MEEFGCRNCMFLSKQRGGIKVRGGYCMSPNASKSTISQKGKCIHYLPDSL